jgi:hypothetical protein
MQHLKHLILSRPVLERVPDQSLIAGEAGTGVQHVQATRGADYAFLYLPTGHPVPVQLGKISGSKVKAWWFNPRMGTSAQIGVFANRGTRTFKPKGATGPGNDWVLVLDDADKKYSPPGRR